MLNLDKWTVKGRSSMLTLPFLGEKKTFGRLGGTDPHEKNRIWYEGLEQEWVIEHNIGTHMMNWLFVDTKMCTRLSVRINLLYVLILSCWKTQDWNMFWCMRIVMFWWHTIKALKVKTSTLNCIWKQNGDQCGWGKTGMIWSPWSTPGQNPGYRILY